MGVSPDSGLAAGTGIFVGVAALAAPIIAFYVFKNTRDMKMKKDNCW